MRAAMTEIEKTIYEQIKLGIEYKRFIRRLPLHLLYHQFIEEVINHFGYSAECINAALTVLKKAGMIVGGPTCNHFYITLPEDHELMQPLQPLKKK